MNKIELKAAVARLFYENNHDSTDFDALIDYIDNSESKEFGQWVKHDTIFGTFYYCSKCGARTEIPTCMGDPIFDYCPFCGKEMKGWT